MAAASASASLGTAPLPTEASVLPHPRQRHGFIVSSSIAYTGASEKSLDDIAAVIGLPIQPSGIFACYEQPRDQQAKIQALAATEPQYVNELMSCGREFVQAAAHGDVQQVIKIGRNTRSGELLLPFITQAFTAAALGGHLWVLKFMIHQGLSTTLQPLKSIIGRVVIAGSPDITRRSATVTLLSQVGFDPDAPDAVGATPLIAAAARGIPHLVTALIQAGADINAVANDHSMPLIVALQGAGLWNPGPQGEAPLHDDLVAMFAEGATDPEACESPAHAACAALLLEAGARAHWSDLPGAVHGTDAAAAAAAAVASQLAELDLAAAAVTAERVTEGTVSGRVPSGPSTLPPAAAAAASAATSSSPPPPSAAELAPAPASGLSMTPVVMSSFSSAAIFVPKKP